MAFLQWRRFNFFERDFISGPKDSLAELVKSSQITCSSSGNGYLFFGDISGVVYIVSRLHKVYTFSAHNVAVTHCSAIVNRGSSINSANNSKLHLITIGTDSDDLLPVLKVWRIDESALTVDSQEGSHLFQSTSANTNAVDEGTSEATEPKSSSTPIGICIRSIKFSPSMPQLAALNPHVSVTVLDLLNDSLLAVGFNDGHCLTLRGELTRDTRNIKLKLLQVSPTGHSITGLAFYSYTRTYKPTSKTFRTFNANTSGTRQQIVLFVSTRNEICTFDLTSSRDSKEKELKTVLDTFGCDIGCSCLKRDPKHPDSMQFIVGRNDAIYFYSIDGRGPSLAYDGQKTFLYWFRNYLVVVTLNDVNRNSNESPSPSSSASLGTANIITIYDIARKFIAFSCALPAVNQVISEWGQLYILTADKRVCVFTECDTQTKLKLLFQKNQFSLAIDLAKSQTYSADSLADMFKQYGDHLYSTGDFDGAISQYCHTIGILEPSYVIRRFLDLQRIHNLTAYLQELHKRRVATEDHTTLLINCYVKVKDEQRLNQFLRSSDIVFDVDNAIRVLRQAGYFDNAILLAKKHGRYDAYFCTLLEDKADFRSVLETFKLLIKEEKEDLVSQYLSKYGRLLMADEPDQTTQLLKTLSAHLLRKSMKNRPIIPMTSQVSGDLSNVFDIADLASAMHDDSFYDSEFRCEKFLHIFLNHPSKLIEYLEFIISESKSIGDADGNSFPVSFEISNTLLEMYLYSYKSQIKEDGLAENEAKIMNFLRNEWANYDSKRAMIICQMSNFTPGVLYLYEKSQMYKHILAHYVSRADNHMVIEVCKQYSEKEPNLWVDALWYYAERYNDEHQANMLLILDEIERQKLLPPLMVMEIILRHGKVTLGVLHDYLTRYISAEQEQIEKEEQQIEANREECETIRAQIEELREKPRIIQASKCCACSHPLELPSVHFVCGHSLHGSCYDSLVSGDEEEEEDCPLCLDKNRKILNETSQLDNVANVNEFFQQELSQSKDLFKVIGRYTSQGLFNPLNTDEDAGRTIGQ